MYKTTATVEEIAAEVETLGREQFAQGLEPGEYTVTINPDGSANVTWPERHTFGGLVSAEMAGTTRDAAILDRDSNTTVLLLGVLRGLRAGWMR